VRGPAVRAAPEQRGLRDYLVTPPDSFPTDGKRVAEEIKALVGNRQTAVILIAQRGHIKSRLW